MDGSNTQCSECVLFYTRVLIDQVAGSTHRVKFVTLMNTPSDKSCIVLAMAWEIDQLNVTKYSSSSTGCCILSEDLPLPFTMCKLELCRHSVLYSNQTP